MDLSDIDPYFFLYSVVICLDIRKCLFRRLNRLRSLYAPSVLRSVAVRLPVVSSLILILIEVLIAVLSVLVIITVISAVLLRLAVLGTLTILIAGIIPVPVSVPVSVAVILAAVISVAVIPVAVIYRRRIIILSHQIAPLLNQQRLYHKA